MSDDQPAFARWDVSVPPFRSARAGGCIQDGSPAPCGSITPAAGALAGVLIKRTGRHPRNPRSALAAQRPCATPWRIDSQLHEFYFGQDGMVLIPIEHLSKDGITTAFQEALLAHTALDAAWIDLFNRAFALYWTRVADLHARAPQHWLPPRVQHVCVRTSAAGGNPFVQLFNRSSWTIEACDFRPASSTLEYAAYQFAHAERLGLLQQILPALVSNLSYFLVLSSDELGNFREGCRLSQRGDAEAFRALSRATRWIEDVYHEQLRPPSLYMPGYMMLPYGGLIMREDQQSKLDALQRSWAQAAQGVIDGHRRFHAKPSPDRGQRICDWLVAEKPPLLVVGKEGRILWDPANHESTGDLLPKLERVTEHAEDRVLKELEVVAYHSRRFLNSLRDPTGLVDPPHFITPGGLSHIHPTRKLIAYSIEDERNYLRLVEPAPPFERLMLGARTMHEWGHLSAESHWIRVPEAEQAKYEEKRAELAALIESLQANAPAQVRAATAAEFDQLKAASKSGSPGRLLVGKMVQRSEDFQANLLAKRYLRTAEMETYIRNNVYSLVTERETTGVYARLLRYAYQFQYLRLSRIADPMDSFLKSSWFAEQYFQGGIVTEAQFQQVVNLVGELCGFYAIDESKFDFSTLGS